MDIKHKREYILFEIKKLLDLSNFVINTSFYPKNILTFKTAEDFHCFVPDLKSRFDVVPRVENS